MLTIDGSRYSGSGTIVRQAVAFSALTASACPIADAPLCGSTIQSALFPV
jgi:RNA 3'-terminal phosphate cyclase